MKEYECNKCLKTFNRKSNYNTHINRKSPCGDKDRTVELENKIKELEYILQLERKDRELELARKDNYIKDLEIQNLKNNELINMKTDVNNTSNSNNNSNNNNNNSNNVNNNTLNMINNFGKENTDYLTFEDINTCLLNGVTGNADLFDMIHRNPNYPENHNIKMKKNSNTLMAYDNGKWVQSNKEHITHLHIKKTSTLYKKHLREKGDTIYDITDEERARYRELTTDRDERYTEKMQNVITDRVKNYSVD